jgi:hypothetical protein
MSFKRTIVIAVIFLLIGGFYYFHEIKGKPVREELKRKESSVFSIEEEKINLITFLRKDIESLAKANNLEKFIFEKRDDHWYIKEPTESRADKDTLESLVKALATSSRDEIIDKTGKDIEKYGLDNPRYELVISDGSKEEILLIGDNTIDDRSFYAKLKDEPTIYLISTNLKYNLDRKSDDYRDRTIVDIPKEEINRVVYHRNKETYVFDKTGEHWTTSHKSIPRPGTDEISTFIHYLTSLRAKAFMPNDINTQKKLGIKDSSFWMEIYGKDMAKPVLLRVGNYDENLGNLYISVVGANDIFGIPLLEIEKLNKFPSDFLDRKLLKIDTNDVTLFEGQVDGKTYTFSREDTTGKKKGADAKYRWKLTSPAAKEVEAELTANVLSSLANMYVKNAFTSDKDQIYHGFDKPALHIKGQRYDKKVLFDVTFGNQVADPNDQDSVYARVKGEKTVLHVNKASMEHLREQLLQAARVEDEQKNSPDPDSQTKNDEKKN